jgi:hypothetical protein
MDLSMYIILALTGTIMFVVFVVHNRNGSPFPSIGQWLKYSVAGLIILILLYLLWSIIRKYLGW